MPCKQYQKKAKIVVLISEGEKKKRITQDKYQHRGKQRRIFYNNNRINPSRRQDNYKHICTNSILLKIHEAKLTELKGEIDNSTIIVEDFNTPLSLIDRPTGHKISKEIENLNNILNRVNQTLTENSTQKQTHILSSMFFRIDHLLGHKTNLRKAIRTEIIQSMFSNHNG